MTTFRIFKYLLCSNRDSYNHVLMILRLSNVRFTLSHVALHVSHVALSLLTSPFGTNPAFQILLRTFLHNPYLPKLISKFKPNIVKAFLLSCASLIL